MTESNNGSQKLVYDDSSREPCHWHSNISFARMHPGDKAWDLRRSRILFNASSSNLQALGDRFNIRPGFKEALNKAVEHLYSNTYSYFYSCSATMTANGDSSKLLVLITGANQVSLAARIGESIIADLRAFCRVSATTQPSNWQRQADTSFYSAAEISARPRNGIVEALLAVTIDVTRYSWYEPIARGAFRCGEIEARCSHGRGGVLS